MTTTDHKLIAMKKILLLFSFFIGIFATEAQTKDELKSKLAIEKDSLKAVEGRVKAIQSQIDGLPGWKIGAFGTIGGSISSFKNWYAQGTPNNNSGNIGFTVNASANLNHEKFFWKNAANINLTWVKLDDKDDPDDNEGFQEATDVFNLTSLYGRKLNKTFAISGLVEYRTTILSNFNDPGYLDIGVGGTWTPIKDLVVVFHPLNYNFVFSKETSVFDSSLGAKIVADYTKNIGDLNFKSNLSIFESYKDSNLSNWTWTNAFGYKLWKMIGVGFEFGLRDNKQEALNYSINTLGNTDETFDSVDNDLQSYWMFGLNYKF